MQAPQRRKKYMLILVYLALGSTSVLFILPLLLMIVGSLKPDSQVLLEAGSWVAFWSPDLSLDNYHDVFKRVDFLRYFWNSSLIAGVIVITGLVVNSLAGYAFSRLRWRGREILLFMVVAIMIIPLEGIAVPLFIW